MAHIIQATTRKVTNYIGRSERDKAHEIAASIADFRQRYRKISCLYSKEAIFNFDQTGFQYEPADLRTLSLKGERDTNLLLDSRTKHTHSYTVQPMVARDGTLFPRVLIVLSECNGVFGPKIAEHIAELERS